MRFNPVPLMAILLFFSYASFAQDAPQKREDDGRYRLSLKSGSFIPQKNIADARIDEVNRKAYRAEGKSFVIIQFESIPTQKEKDQLRQEGIELLDYVPNNAYTATVTSSLNSTTLNRMRARAIIELSPEQKIQPSLAKGVFPNWAVKAAGTVDVWVSFPKTFSYEMVSAEIKAKNFEIVSTEYKSYN